MNNQVFYSLPVEVQEEAKGLLKGYSECVVIYYYGKYHVSTGTCIMNEYPHDYEVIGRFLAKEIFSEKERVENYINSFGSYPSNYKGKRDYALLRKMADGRHINSEGKLTYWIGKINDEGDFVLDKLVSR